MALNYFKNVLFKPKYCIFYRSFGKHYYEMPDVYRNSFYLANSSLNENVNYFAQLGFEKVYSDLVDQVIEKHIELSIEQAKHNVQNVIKHLDKYNCIIDVNFPLKRNGGEIDVIRGLRVYHGLSQFDSCIGGFRVCEDLLKAHCKGFSILSMYRHACFGLEFAGAHGGIAISHQSLSPDEMKDAIQTYISRLNANSGFVDIIESDIYCGKSEMDWMSSKCIDNKNLYVMGKSHELGGVNNYEDAGATCVVHVLQLFMANKDAMERINNDGLIKDKTFIIQGLGKLGSKIALMLSDLGAICVGIKEIDCCMYDTNGINVKDVLAHKHKNGTVLGFSSKTKPVINHFILTEMCDMLILAASHNSLSCYAADKLKASIIIEAANATTSPMANKILSKSKLIIPDIIAGSGSTLMSYLEFMKLDNKGIKKDEASEDDVLKKMLEITMSGVCKINKDMELGLDYRTAAYIKAIYKLFEKTIALDTVELMKSVE